MNAISLYVSASRLLFQSDNEDQNYSDLYRLVPYLRQSLSCTVCASLLVEPYSPQDVCQHHVCRTCIGGRKNLKPTCSSCRNYQNYQANTQLRILLQCYKALCKYILGVPVIYSSMHKYVHVDGFVNGNNGARNLAELINEGAHFHDDYKSNSGLPKSAFSILPCIFTSSSQTNHQNNSNSISSMAGTNKVNQPISVTVTSATSTALSIVSSTTAADVKPITGNMLTGKTMLSNAPIKTVSNGTALYSVMYAGTGNKITIKRKTDDGAQGGKNLSAKEVLSILSGTTVSKGNTVIATASSSNSTSSSGTIGKTASIITNTSGVNIGTFQPAKSLPTTHQIIHQSTNQLKTFATSQPQPIIVQQIQSFKKPIASKVKQVQKRKGCRCGNATPTPGKLTCCGQRCPCYVDSKSCIDCKCRGCRNPHRIDGLKVRPQIPELTCFVRMNENQMDLPMETFTTTTTTTMSQPRIKQERMSPISNPSILNSSVNRHSQIDLHSDAIEYIIPNELDDSNIQVVNVYKSHMPEISSTLPTIIMQDEMITNTSKNGSSSSLSTRLAMPTEKPPYSLLGDDIMKHSFSDDACSSEERSDIEIDI